MDTNCPISKENYQFLPGAYVKIRAISKSYSWKIATHASKIIILFGALSGPLWTDTNIMGFRTPCFKRTSLNTSRDRSVQKSSMSEAAEFLPFFQLQIAMYVRPLQPIEPSFFFTCSINRWDQLMLFPNWKVMIRNFHSILEVYRNCRLFFWHRNTKRHSCIVIRRKENSIFFRKQRR